jgi:hypothetical protein
MVISRSKMPLKISCSTRASTEQSACRYRCGWWSTPERIVMAVADGFGHSLEAAIATEVVIASIGASLQRPFEEFFAACAARLSHKHNVAIALAIVDLNKQSITMASMGTIRVVLLKSGIDQDLGGMSVVADKDARCLTGETRTLATGDLLAMFSEGFDEFSALRESIAIVPQTGMDHAKIITERWVRKGEDAAVLIYQH